MGPDAPRTTWQVAEELVGCRPKRSTLAFAALITLAWLLNVPALAVPTKIQVQARPPSVVVGEATTIEIALLDSENRPAVAAQEYLIEISVSGRVAATIRVAPHSTGGAALLQLSEAGMIEVRARHRELLDGSTFVNVRPRSGALWRDRSKVLQPVPVARALRPMLPHFTRAAFQAPLAPRPPVTDTPTPVTEPTPTPKASLKVAIRYSPHRSVLADGKDAATIAGYPQTVDGLAAEDLTLRLVASDGLLSPRDLLIQRGSHMGEVRLTSDRTGEVSIEILPGAIEIDGAARFTVPFAPPITRLRIEPGPPQISLVDEGEIVVQLVDDKGTRLTTDYQRPLSVMLTSGRAIIPDPDAPIAAGTSLRRIKVLPTGLQKIRLKFASDSLPDAETEIQVAVPMLLLILTVGGGAVGGWVAAAQTRTGIITRVLIGIVAAFVLYWGALYIGLPILSRAAALNPVTALVVAILGGYGGTAVLNSILKRLSLADTPTAS